jgi:hypothetical protein
VRDGRPGGKGWGDLMAFHRSLYMIAGNNSKAMMNRRTLNCGLRYNSVFLLQRIVT